MKDYQKINSIYERDVQKKFTDRYSLPEFEYLSVLPWNTFEKIDGTNIKIHYDPSINQHRPFRIGGRVKDSSLKFSFVECLYDIMFERLDKLKEIFYDAKNSPFTLYGEGVGPGINSNKFNKCFKKYEFILFDVQIGHWWLKDQIVSDISNKLEIRNAPYIGALTFAEAIEFIKNKPKSILENHLMEGLILKPNVQLFNRNGERIITKVKANDFK